jgi:hypothetical protein
VFGASWRGQPHRKTVETQWKLVDPASSQSYASLFKG